MKVIFRVILKMGYREAWFQFENEADAVTFAKQALMHMVSSEDVSKIFSVTMQIVNKEAEEQEEE